MIDERFESFKYFDKTGLNDMFVTACEHGQLETIEYLLTSSELEENAEINIEDDKGFRWACLNGQLEVVDYLLNSKKLSNHANMYSQEESGFHLACFMNHIHIIKFLIFEMNIEKTISIQSYLNIKENEKEDIKLQINDWFKIRELNRKLHNELNSDKINQKRMKV